MFVTNAISPAKVQRVTIVDDGDRVMEVVVEDKQLSLAIGKKGQNVRLAAKLTGWKIDIKSEEEKRREVEEQFAGLAADALEDGRGAVRRATRPPVEAVRRPPRTQRRPRPTSRPSRPTNRRPPQAPRQRADASQGEGPAPAEGRRRRDQPET